MRNLLIEATGLTKRYGKRSVVQNVNMAVGSNEIVGIIGPNGAGKTTTLEMLLGIRRPDAGKVRYGLKEPARQLGAQLQSTPFFPVLTVTENMRMFAAFQNLNLTKEQLQEALVRFSLEEVARTAALRLSGGQQKRLAIAIVTLHRPRLIVLDEPTAALDPRARQAIRTLIQDLNREGASVIFSSHDMGEVAVLAHRVVMIDQGSVVADGKPEQLCREQDVPNLEALYLKLTEEKEGA